MFGHKISIKLHACILVNTNYNYRSGYCYNGSWSNITSYNNFQPVTQGDIAGYQVYYNGTMMNVNSSTTALTFTAPSLPDGVFTGTVVVMVTATNRYGIGPPSDSDTAEITGTYIMCVCVHVCVRTCVRALKLPSL